MGLRPCLWVFRVMFYRMFVCVFCSASSVYSYGNSTEHSTCLSLASLSRFGFDIDRTEWYSMRHAFDYILNWPIQFFYPAECRWFLNGFFPNKTMATTEQPEVLKSALNIKKQINHTMTYYIIWNMHYRQCMIKYALIDIGSPTQYYCLIII